MKGREQVFGRGLTYLYVATLHDKNALVCATRLTTRLNIKSPPSASKNVGVENGRTAHDCASFPVYIS